MQENIWSQFKPVPEQSYNLETVISTSPMLREVAEIVAAESRYTSNPIIAETVLKYMEALLWLRVNYVRRTLQPSWREHYDVTWVMPSLFAVLVKQIGSVKNIDLDIRVDPITDLAEPDLEQMQNVSRAMRYLEQFGIPMGTELPRTKEGSYDYMTMTVIDNIVRSTNADVHPVNAFFASITSNKLTEDIFSPRVNYGTTRRFSILIDKLVRRPDIADDDIPLREMDRKSEGFKERGNSNRNVSRSDTKRYSSAATTAKETRTSDETAKERV